jgi:hypothetical protein
MAAVAMESGSAEYRERLFLLVMALAMVPPFAALAGKISG